MEFVGVDAGSDSIHVVCTHVSVQVMRLNVLSPSLWSTPNQEDREVHRKGEHLTEMSSELRAIKNCRELHVCWNKPKQPYSLGAGWQ